MVVYATRTQRFLLIERTPQVGFWQSVTGTLEAGETPQKTAVREVFEELGLQAQPQATGVERVFEIMPQWRDRYAPDVHQNLEFEFRLSVADEFIPVLNPKEHSCYQWLGAAGAAERVFSYTNRDAILQWQVELSLSKR